MGHDVKHQKSGQKIECNHPLYHFKRRVWNSNVDRFPSVIFECKSDEDVISAVRYANEHGLKVSVRGGGFHAAGKAVQDKAVLIDLSHMNEIHIDEVSKIASIGAGARLFEIDEITQEYGLAVPLGMNSNIGISGLALGGGLGNLRGKYGLTSDNIVGIHLVTGEGKLIYINRFEHPELFWAMRGAGANFGVVTKFEMKLHPVGQNILGIHVLYDYKDLQQILVNAEKYRQTAVDEITFNITISNASSGQAYVRLTGMFVGELNLEVERKIIQPLLELATPIADYTEVLPYVDMQKKFDGEVGNGFALEVISFFFHDLKKEAIQVLMDELANTTIPVHCFLFELHGQINRIATYETAFTIRDASYLLVIEADIGDYPIETEIWVHDMYEKLLPYSYNQTSYLNSSKVDDDVIRNSYKCILNRLVALKKEYDPDNLFCSEHKLLG